MRDFEHNILRVDYSDSVQPTDLLELALMAAKCGPEWKIAKSTINLFKYMNCLELTDRKVGIYMVKALMEPYPRYFFDALKQTNKLYHLFPSLYSLLQTPEHVKWHPEGNTYEHTMLVLTSAAKSDSYSLSDGILALTHDLGKSLSKEPPKHIGHEHHTHLAEEFCDKYGITKHRKFLAMRFMKIHMRFHRIGEMRDIKLVRLMESMNPDPQLFYRVAVADSSGRLGIPFDETEINLFMEARKYVMDFDPCENVSINERIMRKRYNEWKANRE